MLQILRNRDYFWLWMGQVVSLIGDGIRDYAMVFWIFKSSGESPVIQALSFVAVTVPTLIVGPIAGVLVDRWDRRKTMLFADVVRGLLSLILIGAAMTGQYWYALGVTFLASCAAQFFDPARAAMIPRIIPPELRVQAISLSETTSRVLQLAGPALGTAVYLSMGARGSFILDAVSFFLSAACIAMIAARIGVTALSAKKHSGFMPELKEGLLYCSRNSVIRIVIVAVTVICMGAGAINSLGIFIVRQALHLSETAWATIGTVQPLVTVVGAVAMASFASKIRRPPMLVPLGLAFATVGVFCTAGAPNLAVLLFGAALTGLGNVFLNIGLSSTLMGLVPNEMMGRVVSTIHTLPTAALIASATVAGVLAQSINPRLVLAGGATFIGIATVVSYVGLRGTVITAPAQASAGD